MEGREGGEKTLTPKFSDRSPPLHMALQTTGTLRSTRRRGSILILILEKHVTNRTNSQ
jgi:hypothetical protein